MVPTKRNYLQGHNQVKTALPWVGQLLYKLTILKSPSQVINIHIQSTLHIWVPGVSGILLFAAAHTELIKVLNLNEKLIKRY